MAATAQMDHESHTGAMSPVFSRAPHLPTNVSRTVRFCGLKSESLRYMQSGGEEGVRNPAKV